MMRRQIKVLSWLILYQELAYFPEHIRGGFANAPLFQIRTAEKYLPFIVHTLGSAAGGRLHLGN